MTLTALLLLLSEAGAVYRGEVLTWGVPWLPLIGLSFFTGTKQPDRVIKKPVAIEKTKGW